MLSMYVFLLLLIVCSTVVAFLLTGRIISSCRNPNILGRLLPSPHVHRPRRRTHKLSILHHSYIRPISYCNSFQLGAFDLPVDNLISSDPDIVEFDKTTFPDGSMYEGERLRGKMHGQGKLNTPVGSLEGEFKHGRIWNGAGTLFRSGTLYEGNWTEGIFQGQAQYNSPGVASYSGGYYNYKPHGYGVKTYPDGRRYEGMWQSGQKHGQGTSTNALGQHLIGEFKHNEFCTGSGISVSKTGVVFEGDWRNGLLFNGMSYKLTSSGAATQVVNYKEGSIVREVMHHFKGNALPQREAGANVEVSENSESEPVPDLFLVHQTQYAPGVQEGPLVDGKLHGTGRITWANGQTLEGVFEHGRPINATGRYEQPSGCVMEGYWEFGHLQGAGRRVTADGTHYTGEFLDGWPHGQGVSTYHNGVRYEGQWKRGKRHGPGQLITPQGQRLVGEFRNDHAFNCNGTLVRRDGSSSTGTWVEGLMEGPGADTSSHNSTYTGTYLRGKKHGFGTLTLPDGSVYEGHYQNNLRHGMGKITSATGQVLQGEWKDGKLYHGQGVKQLDDGTTYEGTWRQGCLEGAGKATRPNGATFEGEFRAGHRHGWGVMVFADGSRYEGYFKSGDFSGAGCLKRADGAILRGEFRYNHLYDGVCGNS